MADAGTCEAQLVELPGVMEIPNRGVAGGQQDRRSVALGDRETGPRVRQSRSVGHRGDSRPAGKPGIAVGRSDDPVFMPTQHHARAAALANVTDEVQVPVSGSANNSSTPSALNVSVTASRNRRGVALKGGSGATRRSSRSRPSGRATTDVLTGETCSMILSVSHGGSVVSGHGGWVSFSQ